MSYKELLKYVGNKSVFDPEDLKNRYENSYNMVIYGLLYYAYFGVGNNVNYAWLKDNGLWAGENKYPTDRKLNQEELKRILSEGGLDVQNIIID